MRAPKETSVIHSVRTPSGAAIELGVDALAVVSGAAPPLRESYGSRDLRKDFNRREAYDARRDPRPSVASTGHEAREYNYSSSYYRNSPYPTVKDRNGTAEGWRPSTWR
jgi:hypothetical protein